MPHFSTLPGVGVVDTDERAVAAAAAAAEAAAEGAWSATGGVEETLHVPTPVELIQLRAEVAQLQWTVVHDARDAVAAKRVAREQERISAAAKVWSQRATGLRLAQAAQLASLGALARAQLADWQDRYKSQSIGEELQAHGHLTDQALAEARAGLPVIERPPPVAPGWEVLEAPPLDCVAAVRCNRAW